MVSRKLNLKQLVTLSEVYWDDAAKLNEILEALRDRLEPEADALLRSVAQRLETLKNDPGAVSPGPEMPEASVDRRSRRRRWPVALIFAVILAGVAAWFWWPADEAAQLAAETAQGPEIQEQNELPPGDDRRVGALPSPPPTTARRGAMPPLSADREHQADVRDVRGRSQTAARSPDVKEPPEATPRQGEAGGSSASTAGAARASRRDAASAAASASSTTGGARAPAARGVTVQEAQLECYLTDNRPASCGAPSSGGAGSAGGGTRRAAAPGGDARNPSLPPDVPPAAAAAAPAANSGGAPASRAGERSAQIAASAAAANSSSNRGAGGASPGAGSGEGAEMSASSSSRRAPSRAASSGGAADPPASAAAGASPPPPAASPQTALPAPDCPPAPEADRVVFIFDGSVSMALPLDVDAALEDDLDRRILRKDQAARQQYRELLAEPGPKRITRAQNAFATAAGDLPSSVELGLLVFQECRDIRQIGIFDTAQRGSAVEYVRNLIPRGRTPLAESLRSAGTMLGDGRSSVVLLTDGREFCGGDPCAAAAELKAEHPATPIHVVDITGQAKAECIADLTGGRSYKPEATEDLARILRNALRGAAPQCGAAAAEPVTP
jgi:hypothetical protein